MQEPFDLTTIIFALLAAFVVWKVRSILGARTGHEQPPQAGGNNHNQSKLKSAQQNAANDSNHVSQLDLGSETRWSPFAAPGSDVWASLDRLAKIDPSFTPRDFLEGAKSAYELILTAFSSGDSAILQSLLSREVLENFLSAINERESKGHVAETILVSIDRAEIKKLILKGTFVQIVVGFSSKLITAVRDPSGAVVDGSSEKVVDMTDVWTFSRDGASHDPNWRLISTEDIS
jgi:predicted lipid-binding transport protein (Tim44 family)